MPNIEAHASHPSGTIEPGSSLSFWLTQNGSKAQAPNTGFQWSVKHDGQLLNAPELTALSTAMIPHTWNRRDFGFQLQPEVTGEFIVSGCGHGVVREWVYQIDTAEQPEGDQGDPLAQLWADIAEIKAKLDTVLERLPATVR